MTHDDCEECKLILTCCCCPLVWFFLEPPDVELSLESIEALSENAESLSGLSIRFPEEEESSCSNSGHRDYVV